MCLLAKMTFVSSGCNEENIFGENAVCVVHVGLCREFSMQDGCVESSPRLLWLRVLRAWMSWWKIGLRLSIQLQFRSLESEWVVAFFVESWFGVGVRFAFESPDVDSNLDLESNFNFDLRSIQIWIACRIEMSLYISDLESDCFGIQFQLENGLTSVIWC